MSNVERQPESRGNGSSRAALALKLAALIAGTGSAVAACSKSDTGNKTFAIASTIKTPAPKPVAFPASINSIKPINGFSSASEAQPYNTVDFSGKPRPGRITMPFGGISQIGDGDGRRAEFLETDKSVNVPDGGVPYTGVAYSVQGDVPYVTSLTDPNRSEASNIETVGFGGKVVRTIVRDFANEDLYENGVSVWSGGGVASISPSIVPGKLKICAKVPYPGQVKLSTDPWYVNIDRKDQFANDWYKGLLADIADALAKDVRNVPARQKLAEAGLLDELSSDNTDEIEAPETKDGKGYVFEAVTVADGVNNVNATTFYSGPEGKPRISLRYSPNNDPNVGMLGKWVPDGMKPTVMTADMPSGHTNATHLTQTVNGTSNIEVIFGESDPMSGINFLTVSNFGPLGAGEYEHKATFMVPDSAAPDDDNDGRSNQAENAVGGVPGLADDGWRDKNGLPVAAGFKDCGPQQMDPNGDMVQDCTSLVQTVNAVYQNTRVYLKDGTAVHTTGNNMPPAITKDRTIVARPDWMLSVHASPNGKAPTTSFKIKYPMGDTPHAFPYSTDLLDGTPATASFKYQMWDAMPNAPFFTDQIPSMDADALAKYPPSPGDDELGLLGSTVEFKRGGEGLQPNWQKDGGVDAGPDMSMPKDGGADMEEKPDMAENPDLAMMMPQMDLSVAPDLTEPLDMTVARDLASLPPDLQKMMSDLASDPANDMISPPAVDAGQSPDDADTDGAAGDSENNNGGGGCGCKIGGQHNHGKDGTPVPVELAGAVLALGALRKRRSLAGLVRRARNGVARALGLAA